MRIAVGSDHAGFIQKKDICEYLESLGHEVSDMGPSCDDRVDYPDYAIKVCAEVNEDRADRGILICGTGLGMAMAADKVAGIRSVTVTTPEFADLARRHNDCNVLAISGRFVDLDTNKAIVKVFTVSEFEGGRHAGRVEKVMKLDIDAKMAKPGKPHVMPLARY